MTALVRSRSLTGYRALVRELGGDPQPLLARFQIDEAALEDEEAFISYPDVIRLLQATAADLSCADFGLLLATRQSLHLRTATHADRRGLVNHRAVLANKFCGHLQTTLDRAQIRISGQRTVLPLRQRQFEGADGSIRDMGKRR